MALGQLHEYYLNLFVAGKDGVVLISIGFRIYARRSVPRRITAVPHLCAMELCYQVNSNCKPPKRNSEICATPISQKLDTTRYIREVKVVQGHMFANAWTAPSRRVS